MRLRVTLAVVVLGLSVATMTLAQPQAGDSLKGVDKTLMQRRDEVAQLRAEVEYREIEHDVDKVFLVEVLKEAKRAVWQQALAEGTPEARDPAVLAEKKGRNNQFRASVDEMRRSFCERTFGLHMMKFKLADLERR